MLVIDPQLRLSEAQSLAAWILESKKNQLLRIPERDPCEPDARPKRSGALVGSFLEQAADAVYGGIDDPLAVKRQIAALL